MSCHAFTRIGTTLFTLAFVGACSLVVDTSNLAGGGASDKPPPDGSVDSHDGDATGDAAATGDGSKPAGGDAGATGSDGGSCQPLNAQCLTATCCANLQCGDAKKCLTCLPQLDDCTSNAQCCSNKCDPTTTICM